MFSELASSVARERASFLRDVEYMRENVVDARIQEDILAYECAEQGIYTEKDLTSPEEEKEIIEIIDQIPKSETDKDADEEIDRIMNSDKENLTLDEVMGLVDEGDPDIYEDMVLGEDE